MQGIAVSDEEKRLHDLICSMGCVACRYEGIFNTHVSVHHVHGRTRPGSHMHVLPLCEPHHQKNSDTLAVHGSKKRWEDRYGKQDDLVVAQWAALGVPYELPGLKRRKTKEQRDAADARAQKKITTASNVSNTSPESKASLPKIKPVNQKVAMPKLSPEQKAEKKAFEKQRRLDAKLAAQSLKKGGVVAVNKLRQKLLASGKPLSPKSKIPVAPKPTDDQKASARQYRAEMKERYLEENRDAIAQRKAAEKEQRKRYRDEMKKKARI